MYVCIPGRLAQLSAVVGVLPQPRAVDSLRTTPGHLRAWFGARTVEDERAGAILVDPIFSCAGKCALKRITHGRRGHLRAKGDDGGGLPCS